MARKKRKDDDEPKKKKKAREEEYDDLDEADEDLDEEDLAEDDLRRPRNDAYTGMLVITLVALIAACVFFYLDHEALAAQSVQAPTITVQPLGAVPQPAGKG